MVFTKSILTEQTTPVSVPIFDVSALVNNIAFEDHDLHADDIGGELSWNEPTDIGLVTHYTVCLTEGSLGKNRSFLAMTTTVRPT